MDGWVDGRTDGRRTNEQIVTTMYYAQWQKKTGDSHICFVRSCTIAALVLI